MRRLSRIPSTSWFAITVALAALALPYVASARSAPPIAARWHQIPLLPQRLYEDFEPAVFDASRHRIILLARDLGVEGDAMVWTLDTHDPRQWIAQTVLGMPPSSRNGFAAVFDPLRNRVVVLVPPSVSTGESGMDVWMLDLSATVPVWMHSVTTGRPDGRCFPGAAYDPVRDRVLMFGGQGWVGGTSLYRDVWALDLKTSAWNLVPIFFGGPTPRYGCAASYDPVRDRLVIHGGADPRIRSDAWAVPLSDSPASWTPLTQGSGGTDGYYGHVGIYDPVRDGMLLFGGSDSSWYPPLNHHEVRMLPLAVPGSPQPVVGASAEPGGIRFTVADPARREVFAQGGLETGARSTWRLNLDGTPEWTQVIGPEVQPHPRFGQAQAYDARRARTIFFGGRFTYYVHYEYPTTFYDDLWSLELKERPIWTALDDDGPRPPTRQNATLVPDPAADRMWLFGGNVTVGISGPEPARATVGSKGKPKFYADLWRLDLAPTAHWTQVTPAGPGPGPRDGHVTVIDPRRRRMLVFGGRDSLGPKNDLWSLSLDAPHVWTQVLPFGDGPAPRAFAAGGYDVTTDRLVVHGGVDAAGTSLSDVWAIKLGGPTVWMPVATAGTPPPTAGARPSFFDSARRRLVVIGTGTTTVQDQASMFVLSLGENPPLWSRFEPMVRVPGDMVGRSATWDESAGAIVALWGADGDRGEYGEEFGWRIELEEPAPGAVDVPPAGAWRPYLSATPNPARGAFRISVRGLEPGDATLDLMDAQGRRVAHHSVRNTNGLFELSVGDGRLAPGLYLVRLTQGARSATTKVVVFE
jgi:hypothetical protein